MNSRRYSIKRGAGIVAGLALCVVAAAELPPENLSVECTDSYMSVHANAVPVRLVLRELANRCDITVQLRTRMDEPVTVEFDRLRPHRVASRLLRGRSFVLRYARPSPDAGNWLWIFDSGPGQIFDEVLLRPAAVDPGIDRRESIYLLADDLTERGMNDLRQALTDQDRDVREAAVETLAEIGTNSAARALEVALRDPDIDIRESALDALGQIGGATAIRLLREMLEAQDPFVREAAADNLEELNGMM